MSVLTCVPNSSNNSLQRQESPPVQKELNVLKREIEVEDADFSKSSEIVPRDVRANTIAQAVLPSEVSTLLGKLNWEFEVMQNKILTITADTPEEDKASILKSCRDDWKKANQVLGKTIGSYDTSNTEFTAEQKQAIAIRDGQKEAKKLFPAMKEEIYRLFSETKPAAVAPKAEVVVQKFLELSYRMSNIHESMLGYQKHLDDKKKRTVDMPLNEVQIKETAYEYSKLLKKHPQDLQNWHLKEHAERHQRIQKRHEDFIPGWTFAQDQLKTVEGWVATHKSTTEAKEVVRSWVTKLEREFDEKYVQQVKPPLAALVEHTERCAELTKRVWEERTAQQESPTRDWVILDDNYAKLMSEFEALAADMNALRGVYSKLEIAFKGFKPELPEFKVLKERQNEALKSIETATIDAQAAWATLKMESDLLGKMAKNHQRNTFKTLSVFYNKVVDWDPENKFKRLTPFDAAYKPVKNVTVEEVLNGLQSRKEIAAQETKQKQQVTATVPS